MSENKICFKESCGNTNNGEIYNYLETKVIQWAEERGILEKATALTQACKTLEEVTEMITALVKGDDAEFRDGLGDTVVTLIILSKLKNTNLVECLFGAYMEIKDRKGSMQNGTFVKEA